MHRWAGPVIFVLAACATLAPPLGRPRASDASALAAAAERFYLASSVDELRAAVAAAQRLGPETAVAHELQATLALLEGDERRRFEHLAAALRDLDDDAALLHLHQLESIEPTASERRTLEALLESLTSAHPSSEVRAAAAFHLALLLSGDGAIARRERAVRAIDGRVALAWVGTWDNDQGKGFDLELEPESRSGLDETYASRSGGTLAWRREAPPDPRGQYDLGQLMSPTRWSAAFGQGTLDAPADGRYALHLTSSDPLKVWVDGALVFAAAELERSVFDHLVVPLQLRRGPHRLLIKSAHRDGAWHLMARITPWVAPAAETPVASVEAALALRWTHLDTPEQSARRRALLTSWAQVAAGGPHAVHMADAFVRAAPTSLLARASLIDALWFNQERGRTADALQALDAEVGEQLAHVRLRQTRFHLQQGLRQRARDRLLALTAAHPDVREGWELLAETWRAEGWTEDELLALRARRARFDPTPDDELELARALVRLGRRGEAAETYEGLLAALPCHGEGLRRLAELRLEGGELPAAALLLTRRVACWPVDVAAWLQLAEVERRLGHAQRSRAALDEVARLAPELPAPWERRGALAYETGDVATALRAWQRALELNPENESLANRVDFLSPAARGPWMADVPDEASLAALVEARGTLRHAPGADVAWLLDHEVTLLNSDGSTSNVVTLVAHAWNAQGRDRIIRQSVGTGRLRVLQAYAVDERGHRTEASSERRRQIFFRGMQPGSTLVLQYRLDTPPQGFLARHFTAVWNFQGLGEQRQRSALVLWRPPGTVLHEAQVGQVHRSEERRGDLLRVEWSAEQTPPMTAEPAMPTMGELAVNLHLSTVPDWKTWVSWEQALLEGAFRDSPQLEAIVQSVRDATSNPEERLLRIYTIVMEDIRYQQDYETFIAGVKPHAAPVTLERRYGDCKDKAVLFITLARKLGLEAHFALVRTRDQGPVRREVPMQQFNHAIVYLPEQPGVTARFLDPTAELLDVTSLRADDAGTESLVFDPLTGSHTWRTIPLQAAEANRDGVTLELHLAPDGSAQGTLQLESVGRGGSALRRVARNSEVFRQAGQRIAASLLPNATASAPRALEVDTLHRPAVVSMDVATGTLARTETDSLRLKLPSDANPRATFQLASRATPLVLGVPQLSVVDLSLEVPEGFQVRKAPASSEVVLPCMALSRRVRVEGRRVLAHQEYRTSCERIERDAYALYRSRLDAMARLLDDELVLEPARSGKPARAAVARP